MKRSIFALAAALAILLSGCATMIDLGEAVCEAAIGGSKAGKLCDELQKLEAVEEPEAPAE